MWKQATVLLCALAVVCFSGQKLYKMAQIKGWVPGAVVTHKVIRQKGIEQARRLRESDSYWVAVVKGDVTRSWANRHRVKPEVWNALSIGDRVEVIYIPGEKMPYLRDDVFVDPDNFAFDAALVGVAIVVAIGAGIGLCWRLLRRERPEVEPAPVGYPYRESISPR